MEAYKGGAGGNAYREAPMQQLTPRNLADH